MNNLIEILEEIYTPSEIVELLVNIDKNEIEDYALNHMVCTRCYSCLKMVRWREPRGEAYGVPAFEEMLEFHCDYCGKIY